MGVDVYATLYQGYILENIELDDVVEEFLENEGVQIIYTRFDGSDENDSIILAINEYDIGGGRAGCSETQDVTDFLLHQEKYFPRDAQSKLDDILSRLPNNIFEDVQMTFGIFCETHAN